MKRERRGFVPGRERGFTLLELMIVVTVIAVLAVIAISSYEYAMRKSRRATAQGCLMEASQYMERFYATNLRYDQTNAATPVAVNAPSTICSSDSQRFYDVSFVGSVTQTTYTIQIVPQGKQAKDSCGTMTVNQTGTKTPATGCW
ncbi:type IV pilin protein [Arenimonas sp.]|uniref:type IV pilin protein n=1 Tax=Arenimonas sp. TaxID=1872635 RepID=UPI0039E56124